MSNPQKIADWRWWSGFVLGLFLCNSAFGQSTHLLLSSERDATSRTVLLNLWLANSTFNPAGLQWTFDYSPAQIRDIAVLIGPVAQEAEKSMPCASRPGALKCLLTGLNTNQTHSGLLALVRVTLAPGVNSAIVRMDNTLGVSANGQGLPADSNVAVIHLSRPQSLVND